MSCYKKKTSSKALLAMARKKIVIMMIFIGKISTFSYILLYMGVYRSTAQIPALSQQERTRSKTFGFLKDL